MSMFFRKYCMEDVIAFGVRQYFAVCLRGMLSHALLQGSSSRQVEGHPGWVELEFFLNTLMLEGFLSLSMSFVEITRYSGRCISHRHALNFAFGQIHFDKEWYISDNISQGCIMLQYHPLALNILFQLISLNPPWKVHVCFPLVYQGDFLDWLAFMF